MPPVSYKVYSDLTREVCMWMIVVIHKHGLNLQISLDSILNLDETFRLNHLKWQRRRKTA